MSYYANSIESDFLIREENFPKLIDAVIQQDSALLEASPPIEDVFEDFGFSIEINMRGDIDSIWYEDQKFYADSVESFFDAIAPFVVAGSYIAFEGESSSIWAYYFDGKSWEEYLGEIRFPDMPMGGTKS